MTIAKRGRKSAAALQSLALAPLRKPPSPPSGLSPAATDLWQSITKSLPVDFFQPGDLPLLQGYCIATDRKDQIDAAVMREGIVLNGEAHPGLRISRDEASLMASLAVKLRLCQSSRTRPESASLKAAHSGPRPWDVNDPASEFFDD
jgi:phage terminase small subunit